ncbi:MAG: hypothetical protein ACOY90_05815 [Candidatus Zhuqueibacterota bacterium]
MGWKSEYSQVKRSLKLNRLLFGILAYIAVVVIYNFAVLQPMIDNSRELKKRKKAIEDLYVDTRAIDLDELIQKLSFQREDLIYRMEGIESRLVPAIEKKIVWSEIQNLARKNDLTVLSFANPEDRDQKLLNITKQFLQLKLNGQFYNLVNFLLELDEFRYLARLHSFKIVNPHDTKNNLIVDLAIFIYISEK